MGEVIKSIHRGMPWYKQVAIIASVVLVIVGFFLPPIGVIDSSVFQSVGILLGGISLLDLVNNIPLYIEAGMKVKVKLPGNSSIEVHKEDK